MHLFSFSLKLLMATRVRLWPYMVKEYPHHHARPSLGLFSLLLGSALTARNGTSSYINSPHHHISAFHLSLSIYWHFFTSSSSSSHSSFLSFTAALPHDFLGATADRLRDSTVRLNHLRLFSERATRHLYPSTNSYVCYTSFELSSPFDDGLLTVGVDVTPTIFSVGEFRLIHSFFHISWRHV
jgi:hypothetical protein